jgi:hypothetical protein
MTPRCIPGFTPVILPYNSGVSSILSCIYSAGGVSVCADVVFPDVWYLCVMTPGDAYPRTPPFTPNAYTTVITACFPVCVVRVVAPCVYLYAHVLVDVVIHDPACP